MENDFWINLASVVDLLISMDTVGISCTWNVENTAGGLTEVTRNKGNTILEREIARARLKFS